MNVYDPSAWGGRRGRVAGLLVVAFLAAAAAPLPSNGADAPIDAITKPSGDVTLSFVRPGRVAKVLVKEGDTVQAGQLLVQQDDEVERVQLRQLKALAENKTRVKAAEETLKQKQVDNDKLQHLAEQGAVTKWDAEHARLDAVLADLSLKLALFENQQNELRAEEMDAQIRRMSLSSPIGGKVEQVFMEEGESANALQEVVRVVKIDPLRIDVPAPRPQATRLKLGEAAAVDFGDRTATGKITHIAAVADAASETLTVRVEVQNPDGRPAGERVKVSLARSAPARAAGQ